MFIILLFIIFCGNLVLIIWTSLLFSILVLIYDIDNNINSNSKLKENSFQSYFQFIKNFVNIEVIQLYIIKEEIF